MKFKTTKKWTLYVLTALSTISVVSCFGVKSLIKQHCGEKTELVNPSIFKIPTSPLAITNVSVLSADCIKMLDSLTVLIKDNKITQVAKEISFPNEYNIIDGTGQYLIPGLVDTHAHLHRSKNDLLLYLANGVTHIANNNSESDNLILKWRKEANEGALSPKIYIAAGGMSSKKGLIQRIKTLFGDAIKYNTPTQARRAVRKFKSQGYDAIKSYNPNTEVHFALTDEAEKQGIPVIGHLPPSVGLEDFYNSGQSQLAHVEEITKSTIKEFGGMWSDNSEEYLKYLKTNADQIAIKLKEKNIVVSSTLWIIESIPKQNFDIDNFPKTIELEYQNPGQIEGSQLAKGWLPGNNSYENMDIKNSAEQIKNHKLFWKTYVHAMHIMIKALIKNGVTVTAGTDSNGPGVVAGFSLLDELESLNRCGLTESQVLYAATVAPARWMQSNAGKVEIGRRADLILLTKNPLEDIKNTRTINAVITNGKYLDRITLDKMLLSIRLANNNSRKINIDKFLN